MKRTIFLALLAITTAATAQKFQLDAVSDHYQHLQRFKSSVNPQRAWMDTVSYPPNEYSSTSVAYLLAKPHYLSDAQVKHLTETAMFPANSSDQVREELDYLLDLQRKRTPQQIARVRLLGDIGYWPSINQISTHPNYEQNLKDLFFEGREVLGEYVTAENFPKVSTLLRGVMHDMRLMEFTIKYTLLRPRPYHLEPGLEPLTKINSPSFASGHTMWAFLQAFTWSELVPEKHEAFIALAEEIRRSREVMGIHFPTDNEASRRIAYTMIQYYFQNKEFKKDFQEAVKELKAVYPKIITTPGPETGG
jgi:acid phosphatase (class A)